MQVNRVWGYPYNVVASTITQYFTAVGKEVRVTAQLDVLNVMAFGRNSWTGIGESILIVAP
jgi:hypothetical protein